MQRIWRYRQKVDSTRNSKLRGLSGRFQTLIWRPGETVQNQESPGVSGRVDSPALMYRSNWSFNIPPQHTLGIWHLCCPWEEGIWLSESPRGWGIWSPCIWGGEFELHPRFQVKSLAWWAIMGDAVLEDFRGKNYAFA